MQHILPMRVEPPLLGWLSLPEQQHIIRAQPSLLASLVLLMRLQHVSIAEAALSCNLHYRCNCSYCCRSNLFCLCDCSICRTDLCCLSCQSSDQTSSPCSRWCVLCSLRGLCSLGCRRCLGCRCSLGFWCRRCSFFGRCVVPAEAAALFSAA